MWQNSGMCFRKAGKYLDSADAFCLDRNYDEALKTAYSGRLLSYATSNIFPHVSEIQRDRFCKDILNVLLAEGEESCLDILRQMSDEGLARIREPRFQLLISRLYEERGDYTEAALRAERAGDMLRALDLFTAGGDKVNIFRLKMSDVRGTMVKAMGMVLEATSLGQVGVGLKETADGQAMIKKCKDEVGAAGLLLFQCLSKQCDLKGLESQVNELKMYQTLMSGIALGARKGTEMLCKMVLPTHQRLFLMRFMLLVLRYESQGIESSDVAKLCYLVVSRLILDAVALLEGVLGFWSRQVKSENYMEMEHYFNLITPSNTGGANLTPDKV